MQALPNLHRLSPQYEECFGSLCQESGEFVDKYMLDLIGLFDLDTDAHTVYAWLNEHSFILIARDRQWIQKHFGRARCLHLRNVMSLGSLGSEIR